MTEQSLLVGSTKKDMRIAEENRLADVNGCDSKTASDGPFCRGPILEFVIFRVGIAAINHKCNWPNNQYQPNRQLKKPKRQLSNPKYWNLKKVVENSEEL
jgi:hypothetical protein